LNNRRKIGQLGIGIEGGFIMDGEPNAGKFNVTRILWSLGNKGICSVNE
jgi:hypothetical protein